MFLIGGQTKQVKPLPLLLNSGDIVIMSGDSRLAYHGVPKIIPPSKRDDSLVPWCLSKEPLMNCECWRDNDKHAASAEETGCTCLTKQGTNVVGVGGNASEDSGHWLTSRHVQLGIRHNEQSGVCGDCTEHTLPKNLLSSSTEHIPTLSSSAEDVKNGSGNELTDSSTPKCLSCGRLANSWSIFMDYLSVSRININVRQVVSDKFMFDK